MTLFNFMTSIPIFIPAIPPSRIVENPFLSLYERNLQYIPQFNFNPIINFNPIFNYKPFFQPFPQFKINNNNDNNIFSFKKNNFQTKPQKTVIPDYAEKFKEKAESISYTNLAQQYGKANADKIKDLTPEMQIKTRLLLDYAKSKGLNVTITSGFRTEAQQADLRRRKPNLAAKNSLHCQGKAIDISISSGKDSDYKLLADYAKSIGMRWGGDFSKVKERWHFDLGWA